MSERTASVGVILHDNPRLADQALAAFVAGLKAEGVNVRGVLQESVEGQNGRLIRQLRDIHGGALLSISQDLGSGAGGCSIDLGGFAAARALMEREINKCPDLIVFNKFSSLEVEGDGFAPEMFEAIARGLVVITTMSTETRVHWVKVTGGVGTMLPPEEAALWRWWQGVHGRAIS